MTPETRGTLQVIISSLLFTIIIIVLLSLGLYYLTKNLVSSLLISTGIVLGIGYLFNLFIIQRFNRFVASKQAEVLKEQQKIFINLECCNCARVNSLPINFTEEMVFECEECNLKNKVFYTFKAGRITDIPENTNILNLIEKVVNEPPNS